MEQENINNNTLTKRGKQLKQNYKLSFFNVLNNNYDELGEFRTFTEMALFFKDRQIDISEQVFKNVYNKKTNLYNFIKVTHI
jgi:hypothetical protein